MEILVPFQINQKKQQIFTFLCYPSLLLESTLFVRANHRVLQRSFT
uniref:Uncharacterized protein n=1 Tax=Arundo donax TaxID=35708 RepID=A0A0A8YVU2_ARUDO